MTVQRSITLLHISDVQFGRSHRFGNLAVGDPDAEFDTLFTRLDDDLKKLAKKDPDMRPRAIVVSGDLAEWGLRKEFDDAREFLERLSEGLEVPRRNVVMVPGNHDLNRKLCEAYFNDCEGEERKPAEPYARKWEPFLAMFNAFYDSEPEIAFTVEEPWTLWEIEELNLVVAGLNSTMRESHCENHYGWLGERQLRRFAERLDPYVRREWFRLGVVHHNTTRDPVADDENLRDAELLGELLAPSLNLLLHGHTHDGKITALGGAPPLPVLSTGSAALNGEARLPEVPNQYQLIRLHTGGVERWTRRYAPGKKRWEGDTSCSFDGDEWRIDHEIAFKSVDGAFESGAATGPRDPDPAERLERKFEPRDRGESFHTRVLEVCTLRHRAEGTKIDALNDNSRYPYLRVYARDGNVVRSFPIGLVEGVVSEELVEGFCDEVFDHYRALDPNLRCTIVYGGGPASEELVRAAGARNVEVRSFVEFQGIIDFRGYVERETRRLGSDVVYPPGLYVPQSLVYEIGAERHKSLNALDEMMDWLCEPHARFVLVLGDFGAGKTFLLRELARRMPERLPHLVPVFVELRSLEKARTFDQLIVQHLATAGERRFDLDAFRYMLREGRIVLLFDGFDELAARVTYRRATEHFETLLQAAGGDAKVLVTSRTQHFESDRQVRSALLERAEMLPSLSVCHIQPFDSEQIVAFLRNRLGNERQARERYQLIDEIKDLLGLSQNPRMLSFIADIPARQLREARERTGPITAAELYRLLIERWLEYELDKSQPPDTEAALLRKQRWEAVTALALCLWTKTDRTIHVSELTEQVSATVQRLSVEPHEGASLDPESVAHLIGSRTLLVRDEEGSFAFVHASVMEWLVAKKIASQITTDTEPEALGEREMTALMTDFVCDLAGREHALAWARRVIAGKERSSARANALLVLDRLGEQMGEVALSEENLSGRDLSESVLAGATFTVTDLTEASLADTDLSGADFTGTTLVGADLTRAVLAGAKLDGADAHGARLLGADLRGASLERVNLRRAKLLGALVDPDAFEGCNTFGAALPGVGAPEPMLAAPASPLTTVAIHPTGDILASASLDGAVRLWDPQTGVELRTLTGHESWVQGVAFSPDGNTLASASNDNTVRLWDPQTGVELRTLTGHKGGVQGVAFSPDGNTLASASNDNTVRLWRFVTGALRATIVSLREGVVAFTPDGRYRIDGRTGGAFWYAVGLCRFAPGELDDFVAPGTLRRLGADEPL